MGIKRRVNSEKGFTLIEMIGVIAVVAILGAVVAPKVFKVISESKGSRMSTDASTYAKAVGAWYKDIGTLKSLDVSGNTQDDTAFHTALMKSGGSGGLWSKWDGPYIDSVGNVGVGTALTIGTIAGVVGSSTPVVTTAGDFDLDGDSQNDMSGRQVVYMEITGVTDEEFATVDDAIDGGGGAEIGKVKYDATGDILRIYLQSL
ncbi:MAG: type II secretion system protein [Candidatus Anammoxibacter sp.]